MAHQARNLIPAMLLPLMLLSGCSRSDNRQSAGGIVTLDGQPVVGQGMISFRPVADNNGNSSGAPLNRDGSFLIPADKGLSPGKYAVTIQLWKDTGRTRKDPKTQEVFAIMEPVQFKEAGQLEAIVTSNAPNRFDFHLTSVHH